MTEEKILNLRDWYFGFQCQNDECRQFVAICEIDSSGQPFSVAQGTGRILAECPSCHTDGRYQLTQGKLLQVKLEVRPSAGARLG